MTGTRIRDDRDFLRKMIIIGVPVVFQNLISLGLNLIDTLMIGMIGEQELAAVGAANQVYFVFNITVFGFFSGAAVYMSQYWGAKDIKGIRRILGMDLIVAFVFSILVTVAAYVFAPQIISLFSDDQVVIGLGTDYLRIAAFSYIFSGISAVISFNSRAIQNVVLPTIMNAIALCINAVLNYILIFGKLGFEAMGVEGAATATLIARVFEFAALFIYVYTRKEHPFKTGPSQLFSFTKEQFFKVSKTAVSVVMTETSWAVSVSLIFAAYGKLGTSALAVSQIANVICDMLQSVFFGVGNATAMVIGETLGKGDTEAAFKKGAITIKVTFILDIVMTIIMLLLAKPVAGIYNFSGETMHLLVITLMAMALTIMPKSFGYMYICGILRGGGDTVFCMKLEVFCNLVIHVGIAYTAVLLLHTSLPVAMLLGELGNLFRIAICHPRYRSRKWINVLVEQEPEIL